MCLCGCRTVGDAWEGEAAGRGHASLTLVCHPDGATWRRIAGRDGPSGRKPRRGWGGCPGPRAGRETHGVAAGVLFPASRFCRSPAWRALNQKRVWNSGKWAELPWGQPRVRQPGKLRRGPEGGVLSLCALTHRGRTPLSRDALSILPPEVTGLRLWRTLCHQRPQPLALYLTEPNRASRGPPRERAGLECPRQVDLGGGGTVRWSAPRPPVTALGASPVLRVALNATRPREIGERIRRSAERKQCGARWTWPSPGRHQGAESEPLTACPFLRFCFTRKPWQNPWRWAVGGGRCLPRGLGRPD